MVLSRIVMPFGIQIQELLKKQNYCFMEVGS